MSTAAERNTPRIAHAPSGKSTGLRREFHHTRANARVAWATGRRAGRAGRRELRPERIGAKKKPLSPGGGWRRLW
jgi:hypothetical protein